MKSCAKSRSAAQPQEVEHVHAVRGIESADRLVEDQQPRLQDERAGEDHALALPSREVAGAAAGEVRVEAHARAGRRRSARCAPPCRDVRAHRAPRRPSRRQRCPGRGCGADPGTRTARPRAPELAQCSAAKTRDVAAADPHVAGEDAREAEQRASEGRLAGSGLADEADRFGRLDASEMSCSTAWPPS